MTEERVDSRRFVGSYVKGRRVIAQERVQTKLGLYYRRVVELLLEDETTVFACTECDYTAAKAGQVGQHLVTHKPEGRAPVGNGRRARGSSDAITALIRELEKVGSDRDAWKARARKAERSLDALRKALK